MKVPSPMTLQDARKKLLRRGLLVEIENKRLVLSTQYGELARLSATDVFVFVRILQFFLRELTRK